MPLLVIRSMVRIKIIKRQALHAYSLSFNFNGQAYSFCKDAPQDFQDLLMMCSKEK